MNVEQHKQLVKLLTEIRDRLPVPDKSHYGATGPTGLPSEDLASCRICGLFICEHRNADYVPDIEGRIHLAIPGRAIMACGRKIGEHWGWALNVEAVNCPRCLDFIAEQQTERLAESAQQERDDNGPLPVVQVGEKYRLGPNGLTVIIANITKDVSDSGFLTDVTFTITAVPA